MNEGQAGRRITAGGCCDAVTLIISQCLPRIILCVLCVPWVNDIPVGGSDTFGFVTWRSSTRRSRMSCTKTPRVELSRVPMSRDILFLGRTSTRVGDFLGFENGTGHRKSMTIHLKFRLTLTEVTKDLASC